LEVTALGAPGSPPKNGKIALLLVGPELPEDALLGDKGNTPGLVPTGERSFDFIYTISASTSTGERNNFGGPRRF